MNQQELDALIDSAVNTAETNAAKAETPATPETPETPAEGSISLADHEAQVQAAVKAAVGAAAVKFEQSLIKSRRPIRPLLGDGPGAPTITKKRTYTPFYSAVKALRSGLTDKVEFYLPADPNYQGELEFSATKAAVKAMTGIDSANTGASFVPELQANIVVAALYEQVVTRRIPGVMIYPMSSDTENAPTLGAFTAGWSAPSSNATDSGDAASGQKKLSVKELTALAKLNNSLLVDSNPGIEPYVRSGLAQAIGEVHDTGAFTGIGTGVYPLGIFNTVGAIDTPIGSDSLADAVVRASARMRVNKIMADASNSALIVRPEPVTMEVLRKDTTGQYIGCIKPLIMPGEGFGVVRNVVDRVGLPVIDTGLLPTSAGASSGALVHGPSFVIGDRQTLELVASKEAGEAFARNETWIRGILRVDFLMLRAAGIEIISGIAHS